MQKLSIALTLCTAVLAGCASIDTAPPATAVMSGPPGTASQGNCSSAAFQQTLLQRLNATRTSAQACSDAPMPAAQPVRWNPALAAAATSHASDMARRNVFGHRGSDGSTVEQRVRRHGYTPVAAGESIAGGDYDADSLVNTWLGSERHCRTLMDPAYTEVGASCVSQQGSQWGTYWTMVMGNRSEPVRRVAAPTPARAKAAPAPRPRSAGAAKSARPAARASSAAPRTGAAVRRAPVR